MKTKTNCRASWDKISANHSETLLRDNGKKLKVRTALRAGVKMTIKFSPEYTRLVAKAG